MKYYCSSRAINSVWNKIWYLVQLYWIMDLFMYGKPAENLGICHLCWKRPNQPMAKGFFLSPYAGAHCSFTLFKQARARAQHICTHKRTLKINLKSRFILPYQPVIFWLGDTCFQWRVIMILMYLIWREILSLEFSQIESF